MPRDRRHDTVAVPRPLLAALALSVTAAEVISRDVAKETGDPLAVAFHGLLRRTLDSYDEAAGVPDRSALAAGANLPPEFRARLAAIVAGHDPRADGSPN